MIVGDGGGCVIVVGISDLTVLRLLGAVEGWGGGGGGDGDATVVKVYREMVVCVCVRIYSCNYQNAVTRSLFSPSCFRPSFTPFPSPHIPLPSSPARHPIPTLPRLLSPAPRVPGGCYLI